MICRLDNSISNEISHTWINTIDGNCLALFIPFYLIRAVFVSNSSAATTENLQVYNDQFDTSLFLYDSTNAYDT